MLSIRPVDPRCADALLLLHAAALEARALYPDLIPADSPMPTNAPAVAGSIYVIAYDGDLPLGMGALRPFRVLASAPTEPGVAEVRRMFVAAAGRRRGVGRAVLVALEQHARALGYHGLRLETGNRQQPAIALYETAGFARIAPWAEHADDPTSVCFEKQLG